MNNYKLGDQIMSYFYTVFCLAIVNISISAVMPAPEPEPKPNPVFETVNPPNTSVSDIPKSSSTK